MDRNYYAWRNLENDLTSIVKRAIMCNMNNDITINSDEADDLAWALEHAIAYCEELAEQLIYHTFSKQAGFNQIDRANRLRVILAQIDSKFADLEDED